MSSSISNRILMVVIIISALAVVFKDKVNDLIFGVVKVEHSMKDFIMNNPEVIIKSIENMQVKKTEEYLKNQKDNLVKAKADLEDDIHNPSYGNKNGDIKMTLFFDYMCGFCKKAAASLKDLTDKDGKILLIFKELPILGKQSHDNSILSLAIFKKSPENYAKFHFGLMTRNVTADAMVRELGLDLDELQKEAASPEITKIIDQNTKLAEDIGIRGTPTIIINGEMVMFTSDKDIIDKIAVIRKGTADATKQETKK